GRRGGVAAGRADLGALRLGGRAAALARRFDRLSVRCAQVPVQVVTPAFLRRARAAGLQVHVWTVNDRKLMTDLLDRGVDGIMTDQTELLREVLRERGQWRPDQAAGV